MCEDIDHTAGAHRRRGVIAVVLAHVVALGIGIGVAYATSVDTGVRSVGNLTSYCYFGRSMAVTPASNGMQVDLKAYIYKKSRASVCSVSYPAANFYSGEANVQAVLYRASDMAVCTSTGRVTTPSAVSSWGVGKTWNKSGICAGATQFVVGAAGDWQLVLGKEFVGPNVGPLHI
jgi:hypothetical protein